jgi:hypothetical protein
MNAFVSPSGAGTKEVTRPIGQNRAKTTAQKGKGKEDSSSKSGSSSVIDDIMSTLEKLGTSFSRAQMWKQYNKLCTMNTIDMDVEELMTHWETLRFIKKDINFATQNVMEV